MDQVYFEKQLETLQGYLDLMPNDEYYEYIHQILHLQRYTDFMSDELIEVMKTEIDYLTKQITENTTLEEWDETVIVQDRYGTRTQTVKCRELVWKE